MKKWKLKRTKQCDNCPWKCDVDPRDIPGGYTPHLHYKLWKTIAVPQGMYVSIKERLNVMACHESKIGNEYHCIGWLHNQLGVGNNIGLRISMMGCTNADQIKVYGDQHQAFEDTLPDSIKLSPDE